MSRYHTEAGIAAEHCLAPSYRETDWAEIIRLYELLERIAPSPLNVLNRAIAIAEWKGPKEGLAAIESIEAPSWLVDYYLWDATLGELHRRRGDTTQALAHTQRALTAAPTNAEKALPWVRRHAAREKAQVILARVADLAEFGRDHVHIELRYAADYLTGLEGPFKAAGISCKTVARVGDPARLIVRIAERTPSRSPAPRERPTMACAAMASASRANARKDHTVSATWCAARVTSPNEAASQVVSSSAARSARVRISSGTPVRAAPS